MRKTEEVEGFRLAFAPLLAVLGGKAPEFNETGLVGMQRSGSVRSDSSPDFLSGSSAESYAASLTVGSITAYASSGVFLIRLECGLARLYQSIYCIIEALAMVTES